MIFRQLFTLISLLVLFSCKKYNDTPGLPPPGPPGPPVLLKDIVIPNLPSPYYHFEYNSSGKPVFVSFASELSRYDIVYSSDRISEMRNNILVNKDTLRYSYDNAGRVDNINYIDQAGIVYTRVYFSYDGQKLIKLERERKTASGFVMDLSLSMLYQPDGNLQQLTTHRPAFNGQPENTFVDRFEQYDSKINVDGFGLLHSEFFDHLVFLPGVRLQKNNPGKETRTGDGINYTVDYTYTYKEKDLPLTKKGEATLTAGPNAGQRFQTNSIFSYY